MYELYSQPATGFRPTLEAWLELIHADDRQATRLAITTAMRDRLSLRSQYRVVRSDGSVCHIASMAAKLDG